MNGSRPRRDWLAIWILWSAWCSLSGWGLSALGHLDRAGYALALSVFVVGIMLTHRHWTFPSSRPMFLFRRSTYRRWLPKLWLLLVIISLIGGLCYRADNYDYMTYRFSRLIYWWWAHHWYWIDTTNLRMNFSATGFEWLMAPIFVLFRTDRPFFLINLISYLMLPGLVFAVFRDWGVRTRVAWWWMWVLPAGLCYALEAGGVGNDLFCGVYALAAFDYARKMRSGAIPPLVLSMLAIALMTNGKVSNIPLVVPWLIVIFLNGKTLWKNAGHRTALACAALPALLISGLPILLANHYFSGDYAGDPTNLEHVKLGNPLAGVVGNSIMIAVANLSPPILPHEVTWRFPGAFLAEVKQAFPRFRPSAPALVLEESGCLGIGVVFFLFLGVLYGICAAVTGRIATMVPVVTKGAAAGLALAWLTFMGKLGSEAVPRLAAPYYVLTAGVVLALLPCDGAATRRPLWRALAYLAMVMALTVVMVNPGRPIISPKLVVSLLTLVHLPRGSAENWYQNETLRASRLNAFTRLAEAVPATEKTIGLICGDNIPIISLWLPFGSHAVTELDPALSAAEVERRGISYVVINEAFLTGTCHLSLADLLKKWSATVVFSEHVALQTHQSGEWYLLRLP